MPRSRSGRERRGEAQWTAILRDWRSSGSNARAFCLDRGLALSTFHRWRRRVRSTGAPEFVEIRPPASVAAAAPPSWELEIALPNGIHLRFRG